MLISYYANKKSSPRSPSWQPSLIFFNIPIESGSIIKPCTLKHFQVTYRLHKAGYWTITVHHGNDVYNSHIIVFAFVTGYLLVLPVDWQRCVLLPVDFIYILKFKVTYLVFGKHAIAPLPGKHFCISWVNTSRESTKCLYFNETQTKRYKTLCLLWDIKHRWSLGMNK